MSDSELKLNSLSRFSKTSPNLVLEEYSSCEVPAGCGGVVLRWRNPDEPIPMTIKIDYTNGRRERIALDGENVIHKERLPVSYGKHTLAFVLREVDPVFACLLLSAKLDADYVRILQTQGDTVVLSQANGTWRYITEAPQSENWELPDFDDSNWQAMTAMPRMNDSYDSTWWQQIIEQGAEPLGIVSETPALHRLFGKRRGTPQKTNVYIRKTFTIKRAEE